ncbi:MAG TPA: hypothetical protein VEQ42_02250 [Pyrinomonadaceae bacterium]|nr:hypothetical protein [Pyrinomonadaceae bacterium]
MVGINRDKTKIVNGLYTYYFVLSSAPDIEWQRAFSGHWKVKDHSNDVGVISFPNNEAALKVESRVGDAKKVRDAVRAGADAANDKFLDFEKSLDSLTFPKPKGA